MAKRVCYIHIGPHKTGTTSIQWFLKENRAELLKHGYLVPESGSIHGGHHQLHAARRAYTRSRSTFGRLNGRLVERQQAESLVRASMPAVV